MLIKLHIFRLLATLVCVTLGVCVVTSRVSINQQPLSRGDKLLYGATLIIVGIMNFLGW